MLLRVSLLQSVFAAKVGEGDLWGATDVLVALREVAFGTHNADVGLGPTRGLIISVFAASVWWIIIAKAPWISHFTSAETKLWVGLWIFTRKWLIKAVAWIAVWTIAWEGWLVVAATVWIGWMIVAGFVDVTRLWVGVGFVTGKGDVKAVVWISLLPIAWQRFPTALRVRWIIARRWWLIATSIWI